MVRLMEYLSCFTKLSIHLITCICGNKNDFKAKIVLQKKTSAQLARNETDTLAFLGVSLGQILPLVFQSSTQCAQQKPLQCFHKFKKSMVYLSCLPLKRENFTSKTMITVS